MSFPLYYMWKFWIVTNSLVKSLTSSLGHDHTQTISALASYHKRFWLIVNCTNMVHNIRTLYGSYSEFALIPYVTIQVLTKMANPNYYLGSLYPHIYQGPPIIVSMYANWIITLKLGSLMARMWATWFHSLRIVPLWTEVSLRVDIPLFERLHPKRMKPRKYKAKGFFLVGSRTNISYQFFFKILSKFI